MQTVVVQIVMSRNIFLQFVFPVRGSSSSEVLSYSLHTEYRVEWWRSAVHFGRLLLAANFLQFIDFIPSFLFLAVGYYHDLGPIKHK